MSRDKRREKSVSPSLFKSYTPLYETKCSEKALEQHFELYQNIGIDAIGGLLRNTNCLQKDKFENTTKREELKEEKKIEEYKDNKENGKNKLK